MNRHTSPKMQDEARAFKDAVRSGDRILIESTPRAAKVLAAAQGLASYREQLYRWGETELVTQFKADVDARFAELPEDDIASAEALAEDFFKEYISA